MDLELNANWKKLLDEFEKDIEMRPDLQGVLFLIGVRELGKGYQSFKKDEKLNLMHIAICSVLEPYGYYERLGEDEDGWPHFENKKKLPLLNQQEQETFMKKAILEYFNY